MNQIHTLWIIIYLLKAIAYLLKYWCIVSCICVDFVNCFCHRVWSIGGHSVNILVSDRHRAATWPGGLDNLFNYFTYTTSFGAGVYSFWFVELWLGYSMIWQEYHIFLDFIWLLFLVVNPNGTLLHQYWLSLKDQDLHFKFSAINHWFVYFPICIIYFA